MTPDSVIREIGGGLAAVVIVALALFAIWMLRRNEQIQDARLTDLKDANKAHQDLAREMNRALDGLSDTLRDRRS